MEVVSPLTFARTESGTKRLFACSPSLMDSAVDSMMGAADDGSMMDTDCGFRDAKRRRMDAENVSGGGGGNLNSWGFAGRSPGGNPKRSRSRSPPSHSLTTLQQTLTLQSAELSRLKSDLAAALSSSAALSASNSQLANENKILKRAVAIQQERQGRLEQELEEARRVNGEAGERVGRLEQRILMLQYQLSAAGTGTGSDFVRFGPRPPDVY